MSTARGIFETFANKSSDDKKSTPSSESPFAVAEKESPSPAALNGATASPFSAPAPEAPAPEAASEPAPKKTTPFAIVGDENSSEEPKAPARIPERRRQEEPSPFHVSEPQGFGFEAPPQAPQASPFGIAPQQAQAPSPQHHAPQPSPFSVESTHAPAQIAAPASAQPSQAPSPFGGWPQAHATPRQEAPQQQEARIVAPPQQQYQPTPAPAPLAPQYAAAPQPQQHSSDDSSPDSSFSIKQLELRAIFGVDREMTHEEIVQRSRSLPGIRQVAKVNDSDISAVDSLKKVIENLGFGNGSLKLYSGSVPIEFIREGKTLLAVQTDGGFAPGVRETLMLVARELSR